MKDSLLGTKISERHFKVISRKNCALCDLGNRACPPVHMNVDPLKPSCGVGQKGGEKKF